MFPGHDTEHKIGVGYALFIDGLSGFTAQPGCSIAPSFGHGALIDFGNTGQDNVKLMVVDWILETAIGVLA